MDLRQIGAAIVAHKRVAVVGVVAAICLALLAHVRVDPFGDPKLSYRKPTVWGSKITLQLTQTGFPEGQVQDPGARRDSLIGLSPLYARLANTDPVKARMRRLGPVYGGVRVEPLVDENRSSLPLVRITSFAFSEARVAIRAQRQATAFIGYIAQQQALNNVPPRNRVILRVVSGPTPPEVVVPRKKTLPITVFLAMLVITGGVILTLENMRKRGTPHEDQEAPPDTDTHKDAGTSPGTLRKVPPQPDSKPVVVAPPAARRSAPVVSPPRTLRGESEKGRPRQPLGATLPDEDAPEVPDAPVQQAGASSRRNR
jgi:hypothetical protein